jgi:glycosyltransferase involved in cell wall biosynthesis
MLSGRSGLIISDTRNSAISTSSRIWADKLNAEIVYALEFPSLGKLLQTLNLGYKWVFFTWRGSLELILRDKHLTARLNNVCQDTTVLFSVPDHIDLSTEGRIDSNPIYKYADGFTVVSRRLLDSYSEVQNISAKPLYLPDFPDIELLQEVKELNLTKEQNSVIWVGNSRWGKNLGFHDHKGYISKLKKIIEISSKNSMQIKFKVIDRGRNYVPHRMTLINISKSAFLIQTSASEGTGLPLLEALALGTYPLTTDVGINREVFGDRWQEFNAFSPEDFLDKIKSSIQSLDVEDLEGIYSRYLAQCLQTVTNFKFPIKESVSQVDQEREKYLEGLGIDFNGRLRWHVRFVLNTLRTRTTHSSEESRDS